MGFVVYRQVSTPDPETPPPPRGLTKPVPVTWADGSEVSTFMPGDAKLSPETRLIWEAAQRELNQAELSPEMLSRNGYAIQLTVDPSAQKLARATIDEAMTGTPSNLRETLVAVDPSNGRIVAYAGYNSEWPGLDFAGQSWQNPGSAFMPFDLVALLQQGRGLGEIYDGSSPRKFGGSTISNRENSSCAKCTVAEAMKLSINTVFADIAFNSVGTTKVARAAIQAGIPAAVGVKKIPLEGSGGAAPDVNIALGGGVYQARTVDMAGAYATFAANGTKHKPHLVAKVTDPNNGNALVYDGDKAAAGGQGLEAKVARNVTESLLSIPGHANIACTGGHACAGKPGVHGCPDQPGKTEKGDNCAAWMVGYTPQLSTAVWIGTDDNTALMVQGGSRIEGAGSPGQIWQKFMSGYLTGKPPVPFPPYEPIGRG